MKLITSLLLRAARIVDSYKIVLHISSFLPMNFKKTETC
jgi:hypothetical protein